MLEYAEREVLAASTLTDLMAALALDGQQTLPGLRRVVAYARLSSEAGSNDSGTRRTSRTTTPPTSGSTPR